MMPKLETLGLRQAGLDRLDRLNLPNLAVLDLSYNLFSGVRQLSSVLEGVPKVQKFSFSHNPIMQKCHFDDNGIPAITNPLWNSFLNLQHLTHVNGCSIPNVIRSEQCSIVY